MKTEIQIYLEPDEIEALDKFAKQIEIEQQQEDIEKKIPPSRRRRKVSRSKSSREAIRTTLINLGYLLENK